MGKTFLSSRLKMILEHMIIFENFQLAKETILKQVAYYNYFEEHCKMVTTDLSKEPELDSDPKEIQQIDFAGNLERQATILFVIE